MLNGGCVATKASRGRAGPGLTWSSITARRSLLPFGRLVLVVLALGRRRRRHLAEAARDHLELGLAHLALARVAGAGDRLADLLDEGAPGARVELEREELLRDPLVVSAPREARVAPQLAEEA